MKAATSEDLHGLQKIDIRNISSVDLCYRMFSDPALGLVDERLVGVSLDFGEEMNLSLRISDDIVGAIHASVFSER